MTDAAAAEHYTRQAKLAEIVERHEAIIPGPWNWYGNTATDQVWLATPDRGRLIIMTPDTRTTEYVYDHDGGEGYDLEHARKRAHELWCPAHAVDVDHDDPGQCMCDELRDFLRGELDPSEGRRDWSCDERGYRRSLTRHTQVHSDLRFAVQFPAPEGVDGEAHYKRHGGILRSYREGMPKFEVLGYRTVTEWEMDQGGVVPSASGDIRDALYREDFTGLANPNAEFIASAPEDVAFLLAEVARLQGELDAVRTS